MPFQIAENGANAAYIYKSDNSTIGISFTTQYSCNYVNNGSSQVKSGGTLGTFGNGAAGGACITFANEGSVTCSRVYTTGYDFAEKMKKCEEFSILCGDIVGINADGFLTNKFSESSHFVIKSTLPGVLAQNYDTEYTESICFCGQAPMNVLHTRVSDYIIPIQTAENDGIAAAAIPNKNITFEQYKLAVGKVVRILDDGRAEVICKII